MLHGIEIRGRSGGRNGSFSRKRGEENGCLARGQCVKCSVRPLGRWRRAEGGSLLQQTMKCTAGSVQLQCWQWWIFVASCCKKGRAVEGRGKGSCAGVGKGRAGVCLHVLEVTGPDPNSSDFQGICVGKSGSRMEMSLLLQADSSPRQVLALSVS